MFDKFSAIRYVCGINNSGNNTRLHLTSNGLCIPIEYICWNRCRNGRKSVLNTNILEWRNITNILDIRTVPHIFVLSGRTTLVVPLVECIVMAVVVRTLTPPSPFPPLTPFTQPWLPLNFLIFYVSMENKFTAAHWLVCRWGAPVLYSLQRFVDFFAYIVWWMDLCVTPLFNFYLLSTVPSSLQY